MLKGNIPVLRNRCVTYLSFLRYKHYKYLSIIDTLNGHTWQWNGIFKHLTVGKVYINDFLFSLLLAKKWLTTGFLSSKQWLITFKGGWTPCANSSSGQFLLFVFVKFCIYLSFIASVFQFQVLYLRSNIAKHCLIYAANVNHLSVNLKNIMIMKYST